MSSYGADFGDLAVDCLLADATGAFLSGPVIGWIEVEKGTSLGSECATDSDRSLLDHDPNLVVPDFSGEVVDAAPLGGSATACTTAPSGENIRCKRVLEVSHALDLDQNGPHCSRRLRRRA